MMAEFEPRIIQDPVWGETEITEPVLLELIDSPVIQRLKGISQLGLPQQLHYLKTFSRFDHSVGAMLLVRRLGGSLSEQIASVTHDSSHTAFSHIIDWVRGSYGKDDYQDSTHAEFLRKSALPAILSRHGFDIEEFTDYHNFRLLEQDAPRLCADRVDYALREILVGGFTPNFTPFCASKLTTTEGRIVFSDPLAATAFGWGYLGLLKQDWGNKETLTRFKFLADILKDALDNKAIVLDDFYQDDQYILDKLESSDFVTMIDLSYLRKPGFRAPDSMKGQTLRYKFRYIDPEFLDGYRVRKLSDIDRFYRRRIAEERQLAEQGIII